MFSNSMLPQIQIYRQVCGVTILFLVLNQNVHRLDVPTLWGLWVINYLETY